MSFQNGRSVTSCIGASARMGCVPERSCWNWLRLSIVSLVALKFLQKHYLASRFDRGRFSGPGMCDGDGGSHADMHKITANHRARPAHSSFTEYCKRQISQTTRISISNKFECLDFGWRLAIRDGEAAKLKSGSLEYRKISRNIQQTNNGADARVIKSGQFVTVLFQGSAGIVSPRGINVRKPHAGQNSVNGPPQVVVIAWHGYLNCGCWRNFSQVSSDKGAWR